MPTSATENKNTVKEWIDELSPLKVLDIGAGEGTYSDLARKNEWWAIEAYYPYVKQFNLESKYDKVIIGDARYIDYKKLPKFDLIIAADFLEHMKTDQAKTLIQELLTRTDHLLICFPVQHLDQHDPNNPFENHVDHWRFDEMVDFLRDINATVSKSINGEILAYLLVKGG